MVVDRVELVIVAVPSLLQSPFTGAFVSTSFVSIVGDIAKALASACAAESLAAFAINLHL